MEILDVKPAAKRYNLCDFTTEIYPAFKSCERPVPIPGTRCDLHPVKKLWPTEVA